MDFVPSAKPGSDWNDQELIAFNIAIESLSPAEFFPNPDQSLEHIDQAVLYGSSPPDHTDSSISNSAVEYLSCIDLAITAPAMGFLSAFAFKTLTFLGFAEDVIVALPRHTIPLTICGKTDPVQTDLCLAHAHQCFILLVLVNNKADAVNAEAQAIAGAIAAFQFNNNTHRDHRLNPLDAMTIPCITMTGTHPDFYLVPVTTALSNSVIIAQRPNTQTRVLHCPTIGPHKQGVSVGMEDPEYRRLALKRFLAFKELAQRHWVLISKGVEVTPPQLLWKTLAGSNFS